MAVTSGVVRIAQRSGRANFGGEGGVIMSTTYKKEVGSAARQAAMAMR
jgi:hypothetical protein